MTWLLKKAHLIPLPIGIEIDMHDGILPQLHDVQLEHVLGSLNSAIAVSVDSIVKRFGMTRQQVLELLQEVDFKVAILTDRTPGAFGSSPGDAIGKQRKTMWLDINNLLNRDAHLTTMTLTHELEHWLQSRVDYGGEHYNLQIPSDPDANVVDTEKWRSSSSEAGATVADIRRRLQSGVSEDSILESAHPDFRDWYEYLIEVAKDMEPQSIVGYLK